MKSAYELAMEKYNDEVGDMKTYSQDQKEQLSEIDCKYDTKAVEARLSAEQRTQQASDQPQKTKEIQEQLQSELAALEEKREREKKKLRQSFDDENT